MVIIGVFVLIGGSKQALLDGLAPKVILESTNIVVLESVPLEKLKEYQFNKK